MTSPGLIFFARIAFRHSCSELKTRAGPVNLGCLMPDVFATHPSVERFHLGKALAFRGIKSWASVIVVICNHFHHADFRLADLFNVGIFETGERTGKRHMRVEHGFSLRQRLVNWRVNAIAGPLDVTVPAL
jgi:hypothetical protein